MTNRFKLSSSFLFDRRTVAALAGTLAMPFVLAQSVTPVLEPVVVSASRSAQTRFDAPAAGLLASMAKRSC
jgi:hypothetical protein